MTIQDFITEWFNNPDWWFQSTPEVDLYLTEKYEGLLNTNNTDDYRYIILYDQLPRHIFRNQQCNHIILFFLQKALNILYDDVLFDSLSSIEQCFILLPLRHTNDFKNISSVLNTIWNKLNNSTIENDILVYRRFLKATYERMSKHDILEQANILYFSNESEDYDRTVIDKTQMCSDNIDNTWANTNKNKYKDCILSLSGGVDSIVCSKLFNVKFAVHINYCNRESSFEEEKFVREWCKKMSIQLYVRRINEIKRKPCMTNDMRDIYESYTRNVRFMTYKCAAYLFDKSEPKVILGHNKDDTLENIFTNIANCNHYDNLHGMTEESEQDGIMFIRPLLTISKQKIIDFAISNNLPHLCCSTPTWSMRGQIRNNIVPVMDKWNNNFLPSLFKLSDTLSDLHGILNLMIKDYINKTSKNNNKFICITDDIPLIKIFWKKYFESLLKVHISNKSLDNLMNKLNTNSEHKKIMLKKDLQIEFNKNTFTIILLNI